MKNSWRRNSLNLLLETMKMRHDISYAGSHDRYLVGGACIKLFRYTYSLISFVEYELPEASSLFSFQETFFFAPSII